MNSNANNPEIDADAVAVWGSVYSASQRRIWLIVCIFVPLLIAAIAVPVIAMVERRSVPVMVGLWLPLPLIAVVAIYLISGPNTQSKVTVKQIRELSKKGEVATIRACGTDRFDVQFANMRFRVDAKGKSAVERMFHTTSGKS